MTPPISRNQLKKLTQRLRDGTETPEDLHALADVLLYYRPPKLIDRRAGYRAVRGSNPHRPAAPVGGTVRAHADILRLATVADYLEQLP